VANYRPARALTDSGAADVLRKAAINRILIAGAHALADASWIESRPLRDRSFAEQLPQRLHSGEREALALAREHHTSAATRNLNRPIIDTENSMTLQVHCYAGWKAGQRPIRFQLGDRDYNVEEILDQWYGPDDTFYKVRADDGNLYILRHNAQADHWSLEAFRRQG
jgi:hypothetical protein